MTIEHHRLRIEADHNAGTEGAWETMEEIIGGALRLAGTNDTAAAYGIPQGELRAWVRLRQGQPMGLRMQVYCDAVHRRADVPDATVAMRIRRGMTPADAETRPVTTPQQRAVMGARARWDRTREIVKSEGRRGIVKIAGPPCAS